nr:protein HEXIM2 isoform X2 [Camelus bactrianus]XP_045375927.1 protein HEXIM2 isoform X2 [Camelus bactrianus]XP_045375928.1 protein HEXIM2 isoform X2 [Camelus bactrianus]XP_045375929.1 protein HEXIM2 isoform X2 [Camelus bactrianus]XP_045375930.1 protein HEXIM2 isoform X2 [Camelus bactrianus]
MESHSEEEDPPGASSGLAWSGRGPRTQSPGRCSVEAVLARKKHRRRSSKLSKRKRPWRPYLELSWAEKQQRDERQSQRASRVREEMFAKGQPVAPYNTTQFLMNDRDPEEPNLDVPQGASHPGSSGESEAGDGDGQGRAHGEFQQRDFSEAYERYHTESLQARSKQELVRDYLDLERRLSQAEEETKRLQQLQGCTSGQPCRQVEELAAEVERLRTENQRLRQENEMWNQEGGCRSGEPGPWRCPAPGPARVNQREGSYTLRPAASQGGRSQHSCTPHPTPRTTKIGSGFHLVTSTICSLMSSYFSQRN